VRRREKFVLWAVVLSFCLLVVQYMSLEWRYVAVAGFTLITYFVTAFVLYEDLQPHEWLTVVPRPALYSLAVGLFYFLLPENLVTRIVIVAMFGIGMYALFLTSNIYAVAKGRTIQLVHAAYAVELLFSLIMSLLLTNTIFSLRLPFMFTAGLVGLAHAPIIFMSLWAVRLEKEISREVWSLTILLSLLVMEFALILTFIPFSIWYYALFIMSFLYICLSVLRSQLMGRLFRRALTEYILVAAFVLVLFLSFLPWK